MRRLNSEKTRRDERSKIQLPMDPKYKCFGTVPVKKEHQGGGAEANHRNSWQPVRFGLAGRERGGQNLGKEPAAGPEGEAMPSDKNEAA